jgi:hypothetical protein
VSPPVRGPAHEARDVRACRRGILSRRAPVRPTAEPPGPLAPARLLARSGALLGLRRLTHPIPIGVARPLAIELTMLPSVAGPPASRRPFRIERPGRRVRILGFRILIGGLDRLAPSRARCFGMVGPKDAELVALEEGLQVLGPGKHRRTHLPHPKCLSACLPRWAGPVCNGRGCFLTPVAG